MFMFPRRVPREARIEGRTRRDRDEDSIETKHRFQELTVTLLVVWTSSSLDKTALNAECKARGCSTRKLRPRTFFSLSAGLSGWD